MTKLLSIIKKDIKRFLEYTSAGTAFFLFDLFLLYSFTTYTNMDYLTATVWSFFIANTLNYFTNRVWGFRDTPTKIARSYISYLSFAALALFAIVGLMFIFVELLGIQYFLARIVIGIIIGIANYITNHIFTFKIPFV